MGCNQPDLYSLDLHFSFDGFVRTAPIAAIQSILTVKFYTTDAKVFTQSIPGYYSIGHIRHDLAKLFGCPTSVIDLLLREQQLPDETILGRCEPDEFGVLEIKLISKDRHYKIPIENAYKNLTVPDILTVKVQKDDEEIQEVVVEIENRAIEKPYLGGYRDVNSGIHYHHGYTQTGPPSPKVPPEMKNHRDSQTYYKRNRKNNSNFTIATQVATKKIFIPTVCDKFLISRPYETAEKRAIRLDIEGKVRTIQRYFRAWKIKTRLKALRVEYQRLIDFDDECDRQELQRSEDRRKKDLMSKIFPMKTEDFSMLFNMVERWKKAELERISEVACGAARLAEAYLLMEKEIEIIQSIERLKSEVKKDLELKKISDFFKEIGSPIEWDSDYKNIHITMDTVEAQKGREYLELYKDLSKKPLSKDEYFEVYSRIKEYLKTHQCPESEEIVSLIDRVCELTARGMSDNFLGGLKKRIESLVLHHFQLEECNEGVTDHMKKITKQHEDKNLVYCPSCQKIKPIECFTIHARVEKMKTCATCKRLNKAEEPWIDLVPHKFLLRQVRNYERLHHGISSIAFILQDRDIHLIVNYIWHGHSVISECNDIYQLRLIRWKKQEEWAPWNCILLTLEEAKAHLRIVNLETVYDTQLIRHIFNKHALARSHFKHLTTYDNDYAEFDKSLGKLPESKQDTYVGRTKCLKKCIKKCCTSDPIIPEEESAEVSEITVSTKTAESSLHSLKLIFFNKNVMEPSEDYGLLNDLS